jgi:hypothetical protein
VLDEQWEAQKAAVEKARNVKTEAFRELLCEVQAKKKLTVSSKWNTIKLVISSLTLPMNGTFPAYIPNLSQRTP